MSGGVLSIRPFMRGDQAAVRRLILDGLGEHFGFIDEARNPDLDDISLHYLAASHCFIVVECGGEIVGTGALITGDGNTAQIVRVSVSPAHRREGIGAALVSHLLAEAMARGFGRVTPRRILTGTTRSGCMCARDSWNMPVKPRASILPMMWRIRRTGFRMNYYSGVYEGSRGWGEIFRGPRLLAH